MFILVGTTLRGGAGVRLAMLIFHAIVWDVFKLFVLNLSMIEDGFPFSSSYGRRKLFSINKAAEPDNLALKYSGIFISFTF